MPPEYPGFYCQNCGQITEHSIVKEDEHKLLVKCHNCETIHDADREPKPKYLPINLIYTIDGRTINVERSLPDKRYLIGDCLLDKNEYGKRIHLEITSIEDVNGRKVETAKIENIRNIWAKPVERIGIDVFIRDDKKMIKKTLLFYEQDNYGIGKHTVNQLRYKVTHIELKDGTMITDGDVSVGKIKRVYVVKADS